MPVLESPKKECEVCDGEIEEDEQLCGCDICGRLFGPCCNSDNDNLCVECREEAGEDYDG
jgi:hypothetical protein